MHKSQLMCNGLSFSSFLCIVYFISTSDSSSIRSIPFQASDVILNVAFICFRAVLRCRIRFASAPHHRTRPNENETKHNTQHKTPLPNSDVVLLIDKKLFCLLLCCACCESLHCRGKIVRSRLFFLSEILLSSKMWYCVLYQFLCNLSQHLAHIYAEHSSLSLQYYTLYAKGNSSGLPNHRKNRSVRRAHNIRVQHISVFYTPHLSAIYTYI